MLKFEKLSDTFSQKPGAPHNLTKYWQNEHTPEAPGADAGAA